MDQKLTAERSLRKNPVFWILLASIGLATVFFIAMLFLNMTDTPYAHSSGQARLVSVLDSGNIGVVEVNGVIADSLPLLELLKEYEQDPRIKSIVIRLDSPGGAVGPSQEVFDQLMKMRSKKHIVASFGAVAASGAYYIAAGAHQIVSPAGTITGSIGVIMPMANLEELYRFAKVAPFSIKSGKFKDVGNPTRKMLPEERELLQTMISQTHQQFQKAVADGRNLPLDFVKTVADGRIFTGEEAKRNGLVDVLGNFNDAVDLAAAMAGIKNPRLVYPRPKRVSIRELFSASLMSAIKSLQVEGILPLQRAGLHYLWQQGQY